MSLTRGLGPRASCDYRGALAALHDAKDRAELVARSRLYEDFGDYTSARADAERARRDFEAAEPHARRSVELRRRLLGAEHVATAEDEAAWAPILHALGRDDEAEVLLRNAITVLERALGPDHPEVASAWNNLGSTLADLNEAAAAYRTALAAKERVLGEEHPALAITLNNLAVNARRRGEVEEAEKIYLRALGILQGRVDADHPNLLLTRRNLERLREEGKKGQGSKV